MRLTVAVAALAIATLGTGHSYAAPSQAVPAGQCEALTRSIDSSVKAMSYLVVLAEGERGPQVSLTMQQAQMAQADVSNALAAMSAASCGAYDGALRHDAYALEARQCMAARMSASGPSRPMPECDRASWPRRSLDGR